MNHHDLLRRFPGVSKCVTSSFSIATNNLYSAIDKDATEASCVYLKSMDPLSLLHKMHKATFNVYYRLLFIQRREANCRPT